ncbi:unnamed protein product [Fraxinus pennsylvanica]|uniref:Zinc finger LSD1-type domain-containing protein n=1 Tax=Fraxinus pennsylvanica TaxID=56036 RepID=A0AAD2E788_9LAMI|nr:unnamed protein product [Fraxinus pennsylvanica]
MSSATRTVLLYPTGATNVCCALCNAVTAVPPRVYGFKSEEESNENGVEIIKDTLSRVLVHFYLLAGQLTISSDKKLAVDCTAGGAVFVAAEADCKLEDLGDITKPCNGMLCRLVYDIPGAENILEIPPMVAQVTKFKCGGFVIRMCMNHCMLDGIGAMDFFSSWGETARNLPVKVLPFLDRTIFRAINPPQISDLVKNHLSFAVKLVYDEVKMVTDCYMRSAVDYFEVTRARPSKSGTLRITTWSKLSFHTINFGWGDPVVSGSLGSPDKELIVFALQGKEMKGGINVIVGLPASAMKTFQEILLASNAGRNNGKNNSMIQYCLGVSIDGIAGELLHQLQMASIEECCCTEAATDRTIVVGGDIVAYIM